MFALAVKEPSASVVSCRWVGGWMLPRCLHLDHRLRVLVIHRSIALYTSPDTDGFTALTFHDQICMSLCEVIPVRLAQSPHRFRRCVCVCVCVCVCARRESVASALQKHMSDTMETYWEQTHQKSYRPLKKVTLTTVLYLHSFCMCWLVTFSRLQIQRSHVRDKTNIRTDGRRGWVLLLPPPARPMV